MVDFVKEIFQVNVYYVLVFFVDVMLGLLYCLMCIVVGVKFVVVWQKVWFK